MRGAEEGVTTTSALPPQGEQIDTFERLMVVSVKTIDYMVREGLDISGIIQHITCLAEKASKNIYKVGALISYDAAVRERASREGPAAFGVVSQEDVLTYFCYDATEKAKPKQGNSAGGKVKKQANSDRICLKFNREGGCTYQNCLYSHKCLICEEVGHGRSECKIGKKSTK